MSRAPIGVGKPVPTERTRGYLARIGAHLVRIAAGHDPMGHLYSIERLARAASAETWDAYCESGADPAAALDALARAVRDESAGNHTMLLRAACRTVEMGIRADIAGDVLRRSALEAGLRGPEIDATIRSAFRNHGEVA